MTSLPCFRLEREEEKRKDAESEVKSLCKDVDQATLVIVELEGKVESLREELDLVRRANEEVSSKVMTQPNIRFHDTFFSPQDVRVLTEQLLALRSLNVVVDGPSHTDLSEALRDIRTNYEELTQNNKIEIEGHYKNKVIKQMLKWF